MARPEKHIFDRKPYGSVLRNIIVGNNTIERIVKDINMPRPKNDEVTKAGINFLIINLRREGYIIPKTYRKGRVLNEYEPVWKKLLTDFLILTIKKRESKFRSKHPILESGMLSEKVIIDFFNSCQPEFYEFLLDFCNKYFKADEYSYDDEYFKVEQLTYEQYDKTTIYFHFNRIIRIYLSAYIGVYLRSTPTTDYLVKYVHPVTNDIHRFAEICREILFYDIYDQSYESTMNFENLFSNYYGLCEGKHEKPYHYEFQSMTMYDDPNKLSIITYKYVNKPRNKKRKK